MDFRQRTMEDMGLSRNFWNGRSVLVTGHTGFKGAWLTYWLDLLGAKVTGLSLPDEAGPSLWNELGTTNVTDIRADILNQDATETIVRNAEPEIVLHLAAQSLVRRSYREPVETFATNIMGTLHVLQAVRETPGVKAVVVVTSDKCYRNDEDARAFKETDAMGGRDPYSASKGAAELVTSSMRDSFFSVNAVRAHAAQIGSARAGNVIGGGDWAEDRLVPDIIRGAFSADGEVIIRSPRAIRPWQHVLEPLYGYLLLAEQLVASRPNASSAWNFGPDADQERPVIDLANCLIDDLGVGKVVVDPAAADLHEAGILRLNSTKARDLGWSPILNFTETVAYTAAWYHAFRQGKPAADLCREQIGTFMDKSENRA